MYQLTPNTVASLSPTPPFALTNFSPSAFVSPYRVRGLIGVSSVQVPLIAP